MKKTKIIIKKETKAAEILQAMIEQKEEFRRSVELVSAARCIKEKQPTLVPSV